MYLPGMTPSAPSDFTIGAENFNAVGPSLDEWLEYFFHAIVEQLVLHGRPLRWPDLVKFCNRQISEENHSVF